MELLNVALMSNPLSMSNPTNLFTNATGYHVAGLGAPAKSRQKLVGPACPRVALVALHDSGSNFAPTCTGTLLSRRAPQMSAAY
jgi:hypothetical protein